MKWFSIHLNFQESAIKRDGSEDDQFRGYEHLKKGNEIFELENDEALDQDDDYETSSESDK